MLHIVLVASIEINLLEIVNIQTFQLSVSSCKNCYSAEGGLINTNSRSIYQKIKLYREHGIFRKNEKI